MSGSCKLFFFQVSLRHLPTPVSKVYSLLDFTNLLLKSTGNYDSLFNYFTSDKTHHYESEQLNVHNRTHKVSVIVINKQTNQYSKIYTHLMRGARLTPL